MLIFGFFVLVLCVLPGDVLSGAIRDIEAEVRKYGVFSPYCQKSRRNTFFERLVRQDYPPTPVECCSQLDLRCKNYINPGETKFNLTNTGLYPIRECDCERKMLFCLDTYMAPEDRLRSITILGKEMCLKLVKDQNTLHGGDNRKYKICPFRFPPICNPNFNLPS